MNLQGVSPVEGRFAAASASAGQRILGGDDLADMPGGESVDDGPVTPAMLAKVRCYENQPGWDIFNDDDDSSINWDVVSQRDAELAEHEGIEE